jgi:hypothetical protein
MSSSPSMLVDTEGILTRAISFQMDDVVERYAKEQGLPLEVAREHERELKRYLAVCASDPTTSYGMRGPIDEFWHTFIIFTQEYATFCDHVAGRFLHHSPAVAREGEAAADGSGSTKEGYVRFLEVYESTYGEAPPRHLWPRPLKHESADQVFDGCGCTTCSCVGGGCSCAIAVADRPLPPRPAPWPEERRAR